MAERRRFVGTQACGVPAEVLEGFLAGWRGHGPLYLALDTLEGGLSLERLAGLVEGLLFRPRRGGFGLARRALLEVSRLVEAEEILVCDGDGQYRAEALQALPPLGPAQAAIPQRRSVHLPLRDGALDRRAAEAFQSWCIAHGCGAPALAHLDLQPGAFLLGPAARDLLAARVRTPSFDWDLEASRCLLGSSMRLAFPEVDTCPQVHTNFTVEDARGLVRSLGRWFGPSQVVEWWSAFRAGSTAPSTPGALDSLERLTLEALSGALEESGAPA